MPKLKVGFDIDGVVLDPYQRYLDIAESLFNKKRSFGEMNCYSLKSIFGLSSDDVKRILDGALQKKFVPVMAGVECIIDLVADKLRKPIPFITSRPRRYSDATHSQLESHFNNNFEFKVLHACTIDDGHLSKAGFVDILGLDYFVEDNPTFAAEIADSTEALVLLVDMPWNVEFRHDGVIRCGSWKEWNQLEQVCDFLNRRWRIGLE